MINNFEVRPDGKTFLNGTEIYISRYELEYAVDDVARVEISFIANVKLEHDFKIGSPKRPAVVPNRDWSNVPVGTKVMVRDELIDEPRVAYFIKNDGRDFLPFHVAWDVRDAVEGNDYLDAGCNAFQYCKIAEEA